MTGNYLFNQESYYNDLLIDWGLSPFFCLIRTDAFGKGCIFLISRSRCEIQNFGNILSAVDDDGMIVHSLDQIHTVIEFSRTRIVGIHRERVAVEGDMLINLRSRAETVEAIVKLHPIKLWRAVTHGVDGRNALAPFPIASCAHRHVRVPAAPSPHFHSAN